MADVWRYFATALDGNGSDSEVILHGDLPLNSVSVTETLSGPGGLTATISPEFATLKTASGRPIFDEWSTGIWAQNGEKVYGGILNRSGFRGPEWSIEALGFAGYPNEQPWVGDGTYFVEADALDVVRAIWKHLQDQRSGNLGLEFDKIDSGYVIGKILEEGYYDPQYRNELKDAREVVADEKEDVRAAKQTLENKFEDYKEKVAKWRALRENKNASDGQVENAREDKEDAQGEVSDAKAALRTQENQLDDAQADLRQTIRLRDAPIVYESDPLKLAEYMTTDLGGQIDDLAELANFDYRERHFWTGDILRHKIEFGAPALGKRRRDLSFVLNENIIINPDVDRDGDQFANAVLLLGAGEGRLMKRGFAADNHDGLRRVAVVTDKSARSDSKARERAKRELSRRRPLDDISTVVVRDHPHAKLGSYDVGDEINVTGQAGWVDVDMWVRITGITISPAAGDAAELTVVRSDRVEI